MLDHLSILEFSIFRDSDKMKNNHKSPKTGTFLYFSLLSLTLNILCSDHWNESRKVFKHTKLPFILSSGMLAILTLVLRACDRKKAPIAPPPSCLRPTTAAMKRPCVSRVDLLCFTELLIGQKELWLWSRWMCVAGWMQGRVLPPQQNCSG